MLMQAALPGVDVATLPVVLLAFLAGATAPTYYAQERFRGFGRAMLGKLPYVPPPGQEESEALVRATDPDGDGSEGQ